MNKMYPHQRGAAMLILVIFFMLGSFLVTMGIARTAYRDAVRSNELTDSMQAYFTTQSSLEDVVYRFRNGYSVSSTETLSLNRANATTTISNVGINQRRITTDTRRGSAYRNGEVMLHLTSGASFNFGLQSNTGGITLANSSAVLGNVYSNGSVTGAGNMIYGDVVSAGPSGLISGIHSTSSAYAHTIQSSTIDNEAFYQSISGTTVGGSACPNVKCHPGASDQPTSDLPLTDEMIEEWEDEAVAGGTISGSCPYVIDSDMTIGPVKIECDVEVDKSSTDVTLAGPVWITGNLTTKNGPTFRISGGADESALIITDNQADRLTSSQMDLDQSTGFVGNAGDSYILLVSMNESSSLGGSEVAIAAGNKTTPGEREVIYYAPYGKISASQSVKLRGATAHLIALSQSAQVEYETGMISLLFTGGAGGSYEVESWEEIE